MIFFLRDKLPVHVVNLLTSGTVMRKFHRSKAPRKRRVKTQPNCENILFEDTKGKYHPTIPGITVNLVFYKNSAIPCHKPPIVKPENQMAEYKLLKEALTQGLMEPIEEQVLSG